jgi:hypothetical protein
MGVSWWRYAKDVILKGIVASNESGIGEERGSEDPPLQKLRRELNAETQSAQRSEEEKTGTDMRGRRGLNMGNGSRDSYRLSIATLVYFIVIRTTGVDSSWRGGSGEV